LTGPWGKSSFLSLAFATPGKSETNLFKSHR